MRLQVLIGLMFVSATAMAGPGQWRQLGTQDIWIGLPSTPNDVEQALMSDLTGVMSNYRPPANGTSKYKATGNGTWTRLTFTVSKKIGPFTKSADVVATANRPGRSSGCDHNAVNSYYLEFGLEGSSSTVLDNALAFGIDMCVVPKGDGSFFIKSKTWLKEGNDAGGATGDAMTKMIRAQAWPILLAISKKVETYSASR